MRNIFNLDKRLEICANMVDSGKKFIDIGTDHAYLPIWLVLNGIIDEAIAADIREEPLKKAKKNIIKYGLQDKIKTIKTDGLNNINMYQKGFVSFLIMLQLPDLQCSLSSYPLLYPPL